MEKRLVSINNADVAQFALAYGCPPNHCEELARIINKRRTIAHTEDYEQFSVIRSQIATLTLCHINWLRCTPTVGTYIVDIKDRLSWKKGAFGDGDSCLWGSYIGCRAAMGQAGVVAIRIWDDALGHPPSRAFVANNDALQEYHPAHEVVYATAVFSCKGGCSLPTLATLYSKLVGLPIKHQKANNIDSLHITYLADGECQEYVDYTSWGSLDSDAWHPTCSGCGSTIPPFSKVYIRHGRREQCRTCALAK